MFTDNSACGSTLTHAINRFLILLAPSQMALWPTGPLEPSLPLADLHDHCYLLNRRLAPDHPSDPCWPLLNFVWLRLTTLTRL